MLSVSQRPLWLIKLLNYEYWSWQYFYYPLLPYMFYQAWRARVFGFFTRVNPSFENSGFYHYDKKAILDLIPSAYKPRTFSIGRNENIVNFLVKNELKFPFIAKPKSGERGKGVVKINSLGEITLHHLENTDESYIIQDYSDETLEFGVLYSRLPHEAKGKISSLTQKEFLHVVGDGVQTLSELVMNTTRARFVADNLQQKFAAQWNYVVAKGEKIELEPIGNHCRGTRFINANHLINKELEMTFDRIAKQIEGFHYGRFDLRTASIEDLYKGKVKILELNGTNSEPTHIYDASFGLLKAYQTIAWHWRRMADISIALPKTKFRALSFWEFIRLVTK